MNQNPYDASSIKILAPDEVSSRFDWANVIALSDKYPMKSIGHIQRGLEACRRCSVDPDYFIKKYLDDDNTIPKNTDVEAAYREIMRE
jgi:hypothetical protein